MAKDEGPRTKDTHRMENQKRGDKARFEKRHPGFLQKIRESNGGRS